MKGVALAIGLVALALAPASAPARPPAAKRSPVVVELFTAQGCASCGKAGDRLAELGDRPDTIALTWPVDYWDYLGWNDTFAQPAFADRQRAYERRFGLRDVYTPQVVVGGEAQVSGDDAAGVRAAIAKLREARRPPVKIGFGRAGRIEIGAGPSSGRTADVWLVRYDPHARKVEVKAGDNKGATVTDRNVVREVVKLGLWRGKTAVFKTPAYHPSGSDDGGLEELVLVQGAHGGPILAARRRPLSSANQATASRRDS